MVNVGIITFHRAHNYGAVLQAYALFMTLKKLSEQNGFDVSFVDYTPDCITEGYRPFPKVSWRILAHPFLLCKLVVTYPAKKKRYAEFTRFLEKNLVFGKKDPSEYDIVICGSDQIWNPQITQGVQPFYYGGEGPNLKISYAASFGVSTLPEEVRSDISSLIEKFDAVSLRESQGLNIVKDELNYHNAEQVLDPCLLLNAAEWEELVAREPVFNEEYVLVYRMDNSASVLKAATTFSKQFKCKIVEVSYGYEPRDRLTREHEIVLSKGPEDFLNLIKHAKCVFTNSFHATVFSVIFKKHFYSFSIGALSSRIENLLCNLGLLDRFNSADINITKIDYDDVYYKLLTDVEKSRGFLEKNVAESLKKIKIKHG